MDASFYDHYEGYLSILDSSIDESQIPTRSPKRPRAVNLHLDSSHHGYTLFKGDMTEADDDVSSAEYKLQGPSSPRESIFSTSSSPSRIEKLPSQNDELEVSMDEIYMEEFDDAEICTITDVVAYKQSNGSSHVQLVKN